MWDVTTGVLCYRLLGRHSSMSRVPVVRPRGSKAYILFRRVWSYPDLRFVADFIYLFIPEHIGVHWVVVCPSFTLSVQVHLRKIM